MISSEQRSPEPIVAYKTAINYMRVGGTRCPFCGEYWEILDLAATCPDTIAIGYDRNGGYEDEEHGIGESYQCVCGAWFIEGMPDEQP